MELTKPPFQRLTGASKPALLAALVWLGWALVTPAKADMRVCNATSGRVGLAIGYLDGPVWVTEGWFNLKPNRCETIIRGRLGSRYFYVHAVDYDRGGDWSGPNILCTRDVEFSIRGPLDCYARGFDRSGFIEIDTAQQPDWTVELGDGGLVTGR
ncbi:MAG: hypothetical protein FD175_1846 [Beijerinckiaceae bacterium]|nr:MAG: hypothetical protein FD175_1846 [Beijerinckiaceae bacterium]